MLYYTYDPNNGFAYVAATEANPHPFRYGQFVLPANATFTAPPEEEEGHYRAFINGEWQQALIPPEPEPVVPVDRNILEAPQTLFGGPTIGEVFNGY